MWLAGVKYTFVTAIEACVDAAQHVCAVQGWGPPRDNGDAIASCGTRRPIGGDRHRQGSSPSCPVLLPP